MKYSRTLLERTPGDRKNVFALSEILIIQYHLYEKPLKGTEIVYVFNESLLSLL